MSHARLLELVSRSEREGITLGELLARCLTPEELDDLQVGLLEELSVGYESISKFMRDVSVQPLEEILETYENTISEAIQESE